MIFRFGAFELSAISGELRKHGILVRLPPQPFQVLTILIERSGDVVTREELRDRLWGQTAVESDAGLNRCIRQVRAALADDADTPRYIATEPRKGYRFIAPVERQPKIGQIPAVSSEEGASPRIHQAAPSGVGRSRRQVVWLVPIGVLLVAALTVTRLLPHKTKLSPDLNPVPLSVALGDQFSPTFSPDGRRVAFAWKGERPDNFHIYVKLVGSSSAPLRLTTSEGVDYSPAWSPDGRWIAFCRGTDMPGGAIMAVPASGGAERKIIDLNMIASPWSHSIDWSADSKYLVVADRLAGKNEKGLYLVDVETGENRQITAPAPDTQDIGPAVSPDGRTIAFTRDIGSGVSSIMVLPFPAFTQASNQAVPLPRTQSRDIYNAQPAWTPDSSHIVYASNAGGNHHLWLAPSSGPGEPVELRALGDGVTDPAVSRTGQLAFVHETPGSNIWKITLGAPSAGAPNPVRIAASTRVEQSPAVSPDGEHIAFESNRSGFSEIWTCRADGTDIVQITNLQNPVTGSPDWSPDGHRIVFDSRAGGRPRIYLVAAGGGKPEALTSRDRSSVVPKWSADGKFIYYSSDQTGRMEIWQIPMSGGDPRQVTFDGGFAPVPSPDGRSLYYKSNKALTSPLWELRLDSGKRTFVSSNVPDRGYAAAPDGVYFFAESAGESEHPLFFFNKTTLRKALIFQTDGLLGLGMGLALENRALFYTKQEERGSELLVVNQFWK